LINQIYILSCYTGLVKAGLWAALKILTLVALTMPAQMLPISGAELINLIPQKPPFVFISSLLQLDDVCCKTSFKFDDNQVLCFDGSLSPGGLLENIAQTAACKVGYEDFVKGKKHTVGFIGEIRDFVFSRLPKSGEELTTEVVVERKVFNVHIISGKTIANGEQIASCVMKIFMEPEAE